MRKEKMITRTFQITTATVMCLNTATQLVLDKVFTLVGEYSEPAEILSVIRETESPNEVQPVMVKEFSVSEKLFGLTESSFLAGATELPPRSKTE